MHSSSLEKHIGIKAGHEFDGRMQMQTFDNELKQPSMRIFYL